MAWTVLVAIGCVAGWAFGLVAVFVFWTMAMMAARAKSWKFTALAESLPESAGIAVAALLAVLVAGS